MMYSCTSVHNILNLLDKCETLWVEPELGNRYETTVLSTQYSYFVKLASYMQMTKLGYKTFVAITQLNNLVPKGLITHVYYAHDMYLSVSVLNLDLNHWEAMTLSGGVCCW